MQVKVGNDVKVLSIRKFLGLNESADGDTALRDGELARMHNFRITKDYHLQKRPGCAAVLDLTAWCTENSKSFGDARIWGVWRGFAGKKEWTVVNFGGRLLALDFAAAPPAIYDVGTAAEAETTFFGFAAYVCLLDGTNYKFWRGLTGNSFLDVPPYVPTVLTATTPAGAGTELEPLNRLTGKQIVLFSPDGESVVFRLPQKGLENTVTVKLNGETVASGFTFDKTAGTVTFAAAPTAGTNTLSVEFQKGSGTPDEVIKRKCAELYNGATDTRVFLYGDGSDTAIYSGIPYQTGEPSAAYFPATSEVRIGANEPITALVRHYDRLMAFTPDSAWTVRYGTLDLEDGRTIASFSVLPCNRQFGNEATGQAQLLENSPLTIDAKGVYRWQSGGYSTYISSNENNAKRISDRVEQTLRTADVADIRTVNLRAAQEFWLFLGAEDNGDNAPDTFRALVLHYATDTWTYYDALPYRTLTEVEGDVYGFCDDGRVVRVSSEYPNDDGTEIFCRAETGMMDFSRDWLVKYSPMLYVAMKPETHARVYVTVESNRKSNYPKKRVSYGLATFSRTDYRHFSFGTNRAPQTKRVKLKVKKATYYRLVFEGRPQEVTTPDLTGRCTILEADIRLRYGGGVK